MRLELHLPVSFEEAMERNLPPGTTKLLVQFESEPKSSGIMAAAIDVARDDSRLFVAQTIVPYMSERKIRSTIDANHLSAWFGADVHRALTRSSDVLIECGSQTDIMKIISSLESEAMVFYHIDDAPGESALVRDLLETGRDGYIESNFMTYMEAVGFFAFYSSTHASVELLGERDTIRALFARYEQE